MAGSKSSFLEVALLQHVLGKVAYTAPVTLYVALSLSPFDTSADGTAMDEVTGGAYARIALTNNTTNFPAPAGSNPAVSSNGVDIAFADATADWGTVLSAYVLDAATNGNALYGGDLASPIVVTTGPSITIAAGRFVFQEI